MTKAQLEERIEELEAECDALREQVAKLLLEVVRVRNEAKAAREAQAEAEEKIAIEKFGES